MASVKFEYSILRDRQEFGYGTAVRSTKLGEPAVNDGLLSPRRTGQPSEEESEMDQMSLPLTLDPVVKSAEESVKLEQNFHQNLFPGKQDVVNRTSEEMMKLEISPLLVQQNHTVSQTTPVGKEIHKNGRPCRKEPELEDGSTQEHACGKTSSEGSVCVCNEAARLTRIAILCSKTDSGIIIEEHFTRLQQSPILYLYDDNEFQQTVDRIPASTVLYIIVNKSFYQILQADISAMKQMLNNMLDSKNELHFMNFLKDKDDYMEVKYNLPRAVRDRWVAKENFIKIRDTGDIIFVRTDRGKKETNNNNQVDNRSTMEMREEKGETNQVGDENTMEVRTEKKQTGISVQIGEKNTMKIRTEKEETNHNVQVGDENTMEVRTEKEETNHNVQVGDENTLEVRTEKEETSNNVQVGDVNTMEVRTEKEETSNNVQVGDENTMEVRTEKEETSNNVQVGDENTMEVRTQKEETSHNVQVGDENTIEMRTQKEETNHNIEVGDENTMEVRTQKEETSHNVQVGDDNTMEVRTLTDNVTSTQMGGKVLFQYKNDSSVEGIMLTIKTPKANHRLDVNIKKHIDDNLHHINVELQDLHVKVTSTDLGSVIIRVEVEEGTRLGDDWLKKLITTILSEEILSSLPVGTRMEVNIQASLSLKPLNVDIFETTTKVDDSIPLLREVMIHQGNSFVHKVAATGSTHLLARLIESGADINITNNKGHTLLHTGAKAGNVEAVKLLIEKGANITLKDLRGRTPLHLAAMEGNIKCIEELMKPGGSTERETIEIPDPSRNESEIYQIVQILLAAGADINANDCDSNTPLHVAAETGDLDILNLLLKYGPDVRSRDIRGQTALHVAVANGNFKWGSRLVRYYPHTLHVKDKGGSTPLHGNQSQRLTFYGGFKECTIGTPLQHAAMHKQVDSVCLMIKLGADVNRTDRNGNTVLHNVLRLLKPITCQSNINLECAKEFLLLYEEEDFNAKDMDGNTPLLTAVLRKDFQFAQYLIEEGADVKITNKRGESVLHALAKSVTPCYKLTKIVLAKGADINAKDERGDTPLHVSLQRNSRWLKRELLAAGANVDAVNNSGKSPLDLSKRIGSLSLGQLNDFPWQTQKQKSRLEKSRIPHLSFALSNAVLQMESFRSPMLHESNHSPHGNKPSSTIHNKRAIDVPPQIYPVTLTESFPSKQQAKKNP